MPEVEPYTPFPSYPEFARVADFDPSTFEPFVDDFTALKTKVGDQVLRRSIATATRWAAVNTGAIEDLYDVDRGFTYTVAASAAAVENIHFEKGLDVQNHIKDAMAGYEFVLDVATGSREPSEQWIKELHSVICASQETHRVMTEAGWQEQSLPLGTYKTLPNNPMNLSSGRIHQYAPPDDTPAEMARLVGELRTQEFEDAHAVLQAAYAHYAFVCIHPFADGNGRTSRALASTYLYRRPSIPLVIFADQKGVYIDALEAADSGQLGYFVDFVRDRTLDVIGMVSQDMRRPERPAASDRAAQLQAALIAPQGLPHTEMDSLTTRITTIWLDALGEVVGSRSLDGQLTVKTARNSSKLRSQTHRAQSAQTAVLAGESPAPATAQRSDSYVVLIPRAGTSTTDFQLLRGKGEVLADIALREVHPVVTTAFLYRMKLLAEDEFDRHVNLLTDSALTALRESGITE